MVHRCNTGGCKVWLVLMMSAHTAHIHTRRRWCQPSLARSRCWNEDGRVLSGWGCFWDFIQADGWVSSDCPDRLSFPYSSHHPAKGKSHVCCPYLDGTTWMISLRLRKSFMRLVCIDVVNYQAILCWTSKAFSTQNCRQSLCKKGVLYGEKKNPHRHSQSMCACYIQYATLHLVCTKMHSRAQTNTAAVPTHAVRYHVLDMFIACNRNARAAHPPDSPW